MFSLDDLFENYEIAESKHKNKIEDLNSIKCMVLTKLGPAYAPDCDIFNIRGTRYYLIVKKIFWPSGIGEYVTTSMSWRLKKKNKREYQAITLEDVLDSRLVSNSAKEEIIFNLPVFLTVS